jgi:hypothetical protein
MGEWKRMKKLIVVALLLLGASLAKAQTFNVRNYGAVGDGVTDDMNAVLAAMGAANNVPGIDKIYFPAGTYRIGSGSSYISTDAVVSAGFTPGDWIFEGAGRDATIIKASATVADNRIFRCISCKNVTIRNLSFDHNGGSQFGGVLFYNTDNVTVENTRFYDSTKAGRPASPGNDMDSYNFGRAGGHRNLVFRNNLIEDLQVDFSALDGAVIENNTIMRAWGTAAIGIYSTLDVVSDQELPVVRNVRIASNTIVGISSVTVGIAVHIDPASASGSAFKYQRYTGLKIIDNKIFIPDTSARTGYAIKLGQTDNSKQTIGFKWDDIEIARNKIYYVAGTTTTGTGIIQLMTSRPSTPDFRFTNTRIYDNELYSTWTPTNGFIDVQPATNRQFPAWDGANR